MPVDGVEVDRVALGHRAQSFPARQQGGDQARPGPRSSQAGIIGAPAAEQRQEGVERDRGPGLGQRRAGLGQPQHGGRGRPAARPGRRPRRRAAPASGSVAGLTALARTASPLLLDDAVGQRRAFDPADQPAADIGHRALRAAQRADRPGARSDRWRGRRSGRCRRHARSSTSRSSRPSSSATASWSWTCSRSVRPAGQGLHHVPDVEQCRPGLLQPLVRAVGDPGRGNGPHHHQVAQAAPGLLEIGGGGEGQLARSASPRSWQDSRRPCSRFLASARQSASTRRCSVTASSGSPAMCRRSSMPSIAGRSVRAICRAPPTDRHRVVEPDLGIPDRVPEPLGQHPGVGGRRLRGVQQHQVEVGERRELAAAVTTDRDQGDSADVDPGLLGQLAEPSVGQSGQSAAPSRTGNTGPAQQLGPQFCETARHPHRRIRHIRYRAS